MRYTICYSSPFYYLYDEENNHLILQSRFENEVRSKKKELESALDKD